MTTMRWALIRNNHHYVAMLRRYTYISIQDDDDIGIAPPTGRASYAASAGILNDIPKNDQVSESSSQLAS